MELPAESRASLIQQTSNQLNIADKVIEKDFWLCWLLEKLFDRQENMVFKGGTSLSKCYQLIERFSEDVDITIDYRNFRSPINFSETSRSQLKKISEQLKVKLGTYLKGELLPYLTQQTDGLPDSNDFEVILSDDAEKIQFYYPSLITGPVNYLRDHVLLEFGVRNSTEPCALHRIMPYLSSVNKTFITPAPMVNTLSPIRTFWEKATLMHVECHRGRLANAPDRLSRHWYDLYKLASSEIGKDAIASKDILLDVIEYKKAFYNASYANYDACLDGMLRLLPDANGLEPLALDYRNMVAAGMFYKESVNFQDIIKCLSLLENEINKICLEIS